MADLNLVRIFAAVIEEGSVTGAAERLRMSQPAVTQSLNRLRQTTGRVLFEKQGRGIAPTQEALQLYSEIGHLPHLADTAIGRLSKFVPEEAHTTFHIALTDIGQVVFLPNLVARLAEVAPTCSLEVVSLDTQTAAEELNAGRLDLAVSSMLLGSELRTDVIRFDRYCCVSRKGRFAGKLPSLAEIAPFPRVVVRGSTGHSALQSLLPPPPNGSVHLDGFAAIPSILAVSDLLAFVPEVVTDEWAERWGVDVYRLPGSEFVATVTAHAALTTSSSATSWFVDWAIGHMQSL